MRYIHQSAAEIRGYIESHSLNVMKCNNDGSSSAVPTTSDAIEEMLEQSQSLWGLSLPYFIWNYGDSALNLREKCRSPGEAQRNPGRSRIALLSIRTTGCAKTENC